MPTYPYACLHCENEFEVTKSVSRYNEDEACPKCGLDSERRIGRVNINNAGDWKPSFNPAFGCVVKSKSHQREILSQFKDQGKEFEEVGNEPVENIHKYFDEKRAEKSKERWQESSDQILREVLK